MNRLDELEKKLKAEAEDVRVSAAVEAALLNEFDKKWGGRPRSPSFGVCVGAIAALAACLLLVAVWPTKPKPNSKSEAAVFRTAAPAPPEIRVEAHPAAARKPRRKRPPAVPENTEPQFLRIPYTTPLGSYERAEIVRVDLPVSALAATGLHIAIADAGARAQADLVIGEDGLARAVRLISISSN